MVNSIRPTSQPSASARPLWPGRIWWLGLLAIVLLAGGLRYTGYNFSLPYIDHPDEPNFAIAARMELDYGSPKPQGMQGYPPGIIAVQYVLQRFFGDPAAPPTQMVGVVRLLSITFSLGVIALIGLIGYQIATPAAGLFGALIWAVSPLVEEFSHYATADNYIVFFVLLSLWLALTGTYHDRNRWTTAGICALMLAIVLKYQAVFVGPIIVLLPLLRLRDVSDVSDRRRILGNWGRNLGYLALFFVWLIVLFPSLEATSTPNFAVPTADLGLPTLPAMLANLRVSLQPFVSTVFVGAALAGLGLILWVPVCRRLWLPGLTAVAAAVLLYDVGISVYGDLGHEGFRQFVTPGAFLAVLLGVGLEHAGRAADLSKNCAGCCHGGGAGGPPATHQHGAERRAESHTP